MLTIISLPMGAVTDITANASDLFGDLSPILFLVLGVGLGLIIITAIIHAMRNR